MSSETPGHDEGVPEGSPVESLDEATFFRTIVETTSHPLLVLDAADRIVFVNDAFGDLLGRSAEDVVGEAFEDVVEFDELPTDGTCWASVATDGGTPVRLTARTVEHEDQRLATVTVRPSESRTVERLGSAADSKTEERADALRASRERYSRLLDAAPDAIVAADATTGEILDVNRAATDLFARAREDLVGRPQTDLHPSEHVEQYQAIFDDHAETGGNLAEHEVEIERSDGERVPVDINAGVTDLPGGSVVQGIFRDVSERRRRERELAAHRDELARLNRVNRVIREIVQALVDAETREEVERTVCERLVEAEPYVFAWVGELAPGRSFVTQRAHAGDGGQFVDERTTTDPDDEDCPTARALETHEVQVVEDIGAAGADTGWRADALDESFRSCAAVPIVHDGRRFGVLTLYADQVDVFDERERAVLSDLGHAFGHALNALERKAALISDTVREVELRTSEHVPALIEEVGEDGRATFERTIPTDDDYLQYVRVENISTDRFEAILDEYPWCTGVRRIRDGDPAVYELRSTQPSITSRLVSYGGRVRSAVVEDGAIRIVAELPHNADVRGLVDDLREARSDIEVVAQRSVPRTDHPDRARISLEETLSDRQQAALEVSYYAGYFEWPRDSTAEEIAESLGVSSPTVHKHLRHAQRQIFEALLDRPEVSSSED